MSHALVGTFGNCRGRASSSSYGLMFSLILVCLSTTVPQVPRVELEEAGPFWKLEIRRTQEAPADVMTEALKRPTTDKKKQKNVGFDELDGKVGRIYMPKQDLTGLNLVKGKGVKRQRREAAHERQEKKRPSKTESDAG